MTFIFILFSFQANATAVLVRPHIFQLPRRLFQAAKSASALALSLTLNHKKIILEEPLPLEYKFSQLPDPQDTLTLNTRVQNFDWQTYEYLRKAQRQGAYLTLQQLNQLARLSHEHLRLQDHHGFEAPPQTNIQIPFTVTQVPGMRMAGCGSSCAAGDKPASPPKQDPSPAVVDERQQEIQKAIGQSQASGTLNLSAISFTVEQLQQLLDSLPLETVAGIHTINLSACKLTGTSPNLTRFTALTSLRLEQNALTALGSLPIQLEELHIDENQFSIPTPLASNLTRLSRIFAEHNQFTLFPQLWLDHLGHNALSGELHIEFNPLTNLPTTLYRNITVKVPNTPLLLQESGSYSDLQSSGSLEFSNEMPNEVLRGQLFIGGIEHLNPSILESLDIKAVVNCANDQRTKESANHASPLVSHLNLDDTAHQKIDFKTYTQIVHEQIGRHGRILVNCYQGRSRSASIVIAYLMIYHNKDLLDAISLVKRARPCINPNAGFMYQLVDLEMSLRPETDRSELLANLEELFALRVGQSPEAHQSLARVSSFGTMVTEDQED